MSFIRNYFIVYFKKYLIGKMMQKYLQETEIAQSCFIYVRDEIHHSGDSYDEMIHNFPDIKNA